MNELVPFPKVRAAAQPRRRVLVAGVDDRLYRDRTERRTVVPMDDDMEIRYLPEALLASRDQEPDFWISDHPATAPDRVVLFETLAGEVFEQDRTGRCLVNEDPVWLGPLRAFGVPRTGEDGCLRLGEYAALLFHSSSEGGWDVHVEVTAPLLWVYDPPLVASLDEALAGWLRLTAARARLG